MKTLNNFLVRTDLTTTLLKDINSLPLISKKEEQELCKQYAAIKGLDSEVKEIREEAEAKAVKIRNKIFEGNLRYLISKVKLYSTDDNFTNIFNVGFIGMLEAWNKFDYTRDNRFMTFADRYIQRSINNYFNFDSQMIETSNCAKILPKVNKIKNKFYAENGYYPDDIEVAEILFSKYGIEVKDFSDLHSARIESIDAACGDDDDFTVEDSSDFNQATAVMNNADVNLEKEDLSYAMSEALKTLTEREATIMKMSAGIGYGEKMKDMQIAEVLGLTSERVRQLRHGAEEKMRNAYTTAANR